MFNWIYILIVVLIPLMGCNSFKCPTPPIKHQYLIISISNRDMETPISLMSVAIDDEIVFRGAVLSSQNGQYTYIMTRLPSERGVVLLVKSETERGSLELTKEIWIREGAWIVITRENGPAEEPRLDISVSYEATTMNEPKPF